MKRKNTSSASVDDSQDNRVIDAPGTVIETAGSKNLAAAREATAAKKNYAVSTQVINALTNTGALGTLDAYIRAVNQIPMLSPEREHQLAEKLQKTGDVEAARELVLSHLRLVVKVARQYSGYGLPHADLIQEGNIGLMKAVKRYDPNSGVRLVSYAVHYIKGEINDYVIKNWRLVKVATTKEQRRLFFNLRSMTPEGQSSLSPEDVAGIAEKLNVRPQDVLEMERRMNGGDITFDAPAELSSNTPASLTYTPMEYLSNDEDQPLQQIEMQHRDWLQSEGIKNALSTLDERSQRIIQSRWLDEKPATLHELAAEFGVSAERIRQIEAAALKKMRAALAEKQDV